MSKSSKRRYEANKRQQLEPKVKPKKRPTNPNWSVGKAFYPIIEGEFYLYGQTETKNAQTRSEPIGPYKWLRITLHMIWGDEKAIAWFDSKNGHWIIDSDPKGYYEIIICANGSEVPYISSTLNDQ